MPGHRVDLVDLDLALQFHLRGLGDHAVARLLRHDPRVRPAKAQFLGDLAVGKVQAHEVEAQDPDTRRLVMPGQHRPCKVVKAPRACLAAIPLPVPPRAVAPVSDHRGAPPHPGQRTPSGQRCWREGEALGVRPSGQVVHQARKMDQVRCGHDSRAPSRVAVRSRTHHQIRDPTDTLSRLKPNTPDPDKSLRGLSYWDLGDFYRDPGTDLSRLRVQNRAWPARPDSRRLRKTAG